MKKLLLLFTITITAMLTTLFTSCSLKNIITNPPIPPGCEDSQLYSKIKNPELAITIIELATSVTSFKDPEHKQYAVLAITQIRTLLSKKIIMFSDFIRQMNIISDDYHRKYGAPLIIIDQLLSGLQIDIPISQCDRDLIILLLDKMLAQLK